MSANKSAAEILANAKRAIREVYAWPGGYPMHLVTWDGEALSLEAARAEWAQVCRDTLDAGKYGRGDWAVLGAEINWEDDNLYCCHTGKKIECVYTPD